MFYLTMEVKMRINKIFETLAKSKVGQKVYGWCAEGPAREKFLNNSLPTLETVVSTGLYCFSTAKQKNLEKEQKDLLQWQNVLSGVAGVVIGTATNRYFYKKAEEVIKDIDPTKFDPKSLRKISTGIRVITPMICTACIMRWIAPSVTAFISGKIMDKKREQVSQNKLDIKG